MKLLIVSPAPEHPPRDAFRLFRALSEQLSKRGHTVDYYIEPGKLSGLSRAVFRTTDHTQSHALNTLGRGLSLFTRISGACRQRQYDFILTAGALGWCLSTFRRWLLPSQTRLISWHGGHGGLHPDRPIGPAGPLPHRLHYKLHYGLHQAVLTTQDGHLFNATEAPVRVLDAYPQADPQQLLYLPSGVSSAFYYPQRYAGSDTDPAALIASGPASPRILMVGPWASESLPLVNTLNRLRQSHPHIQLTVVQAGAQAEALRSLWPMGSPDALTLLPPLAEPELIALYRQHDIYLQPAPLEGGVPLSLLEAMAGALPVIAEEAPGVRDVIQHYENGLLIPPQDANALEQSITHLLERPDLARTLGEAAYDHVSRYYTWRQIADIFEEKLFQMLENRLVGSLSWSDSADGE